jgi:hypothetical protein
MRFRRDPMQLPYGVWILACGREVLFSRAYAPMYLRRPGRKNFVTHCTGKEWVPWVSQMHLHVGGRVDRRLCAQLLQVEKDFVAGREITVPIRPFEHMLRASNRTPAPVTANAPVPVPVKAHLTLVVNTSAR